MRARSSRGPRQIAALAFALALILACGFAPRAFAQQGNFQPPPTVPQTHGQGGSTLELRTTPGLQGGAATSIPRIEPQPGQELTVPSRELRAQLGYEQVTVTVTDQQGRYVTDLKKSDFNLYIDGQQRPIEFFRQDLNTPVSLGIVVDTSGSMEPKLPQARAAITELIDNLNDKDDLFLFAFNNDAFLLQPFTTSHGQMIARLELLHAFGSTALYDGIIDGLIMLRHGRWDKKALLVVTDGMDNSSYYKLNEVVRQARRMGVLIYSIGIGNTSSSPAPSLFSSILEDDRVDAQTLKMLSNETGAKNFLIREIGDGQAIRTACQTISRELREQYTIGFVAPDASRGGYRELRVDVPGRPGDGVRVRKGVTVGAGGTESASSGLPGRLNPEP